MGMFSTREPRRFHHEYIYYNERKEKLKKIEENARRELGLLPEESEESVKEARTERIHNAIMNNTKHLKRREERGGSPLSSKVIFVLLFVLLFVLHYLWTGSFYF